MKTAKNWCAVGLSVTLLLCTAGCNADVREPQAPDYSAYTHKFDFYAYSGPNDGSWREYGEWYYTGEDFRTVERYKEYKDAGMTILLAQSSAPINDLGDERREKDAETARMVMDRAQEAGLDKVILTDYRIQAFSRQVGGLIGEGKPFADEAELDTEMERCLAFYNDHPVFYGVMLGDEPRWDAVEAYGQVYKSLKRVAPDMYVQYNLFPMALTAMEVGYYTPIENFEGSEYEELYARYTLYVESFLDSMGVDYVQYDSYPMQESKGIIPEYIRGLQITADIAKERGIEFYNVTQTMASEQNGNLAYRKIEEPDAYWLNNMLLGFGVKQISYYTYWTKQDLSLTEWCVDGSTFITRYGEKTELYYFMQKIMAENQKFAPVIKNFEYQASNVYSVTPTAFPSMQTGMATSGSEFNALKEVSVNKECALVTELYDEENEYYMYMAQNIVNPIYKGSKAYQTIKLTFDEKYNYAMVFENGVGRKVKLDKHSFTVKQSPGYAVFVLPY